MRGDGAWASMFLVYAPTDIWVTDIDLDGAAIRIQQQVSTNEWASESELRRRLAAALAGGSVGTGRWDTPLPTVKWPSAQQDEGLGPSG